MAKAKKTKPSGIPRGTRAPRKLLVTKAARKSAPATGGVKRVRAQSGCSYFHSSASDARAPTAVLGRGGFRERRESHGRQGQEGAASLTRTTRAPETRVCNNPETPRRVRWQAAKAASALLPKLAEKEAQAKHAYEVAKHALESVRQERRRLAVEACVHCTLAQKLGTDDAETKYALCSQCDMPFCEACFDELDVCDKCHDRGRCKDCCVERHGEHGDQSCDEDSIGDGF